VVAAVLALTTSGRRGESGAAGTRRPVRCGARVSKQ
jgi:hypothetical protein